MCNGLIVLWQHHFFYFLLSILCSYSVTLNIILKQLFKSNNLFLQVSNAIISLLNSSSLTEKRQNGICCLVTSINLMITKPEVELKNHNWASYIYTVDSWDSNLSSAFNIVNFQDSWFAFMDSFNYLIWYTHKKELFFRNCWIGSTLPSANIKTNKIFRYMPRRVMILIMII